MTDVTKLCFCDTETTGLDPDRHEIWEVALIVRETLPLTDATVQQEGGEPVPVTGLMTETEYVWQLPVDLARADLIALDIGRFRERRWATSSQMNEGTVVRGYADVMANTAADPNMVYRPRIIHHHEMERWAERFVALTWGAHLVGAVPSFDEQRLAKLLKKHGQCPGWHYHLIDVETLVVGYLAGRQEVERPSMAAVRTGLVLPWKSDELSRAVGVDPEGYEEHTALGDARWARDLYDRVLGVPRGTSGPW